jgi:hypothetical protein
MHKGTDHIGADLPIASNRDRGIGLTRRRAGASGDREKTREDDSAPPATHESAPQPDGGDLSRSPGRERDGLCRNLRYLWEHPPQWFTPPAATRGYSHPYSARVVSSNNSSTE